jgi:hypothetical protein
MDIDIGLLVNLRKFVEEECMADLCTTVGHCGVLDTQTGYIIC